MKSPLGRYCEICLLFEIILCPVFGVSFIGGSTVHCIIWYTKWHNTSTPVAFFHKALCKIFTYPRYFHSVGPPAPQPPQPTAVIVSDSESEEEIDFGFWEKAPLPANGTSKQSAPAAVPDSSKHGRTDTSHEIDLGLLWTASCLKQSNLCDVISDVCFNVIELVVKSMIAMKYFSRVVSGC